MRIRPLLRCAGPALALVLPVAGPVRADRPLPSVTWDPIAVSVRADEVTALALAAGSDRLALGTRRGVLTGRPGEVFVRTLRRGPVHDVAFLPGAGTPTPDGGWLASTEDGLRRIDAAGVAVTAPGAGEADRLAGRIAVAEGAVAVATAGGAFVSTDARTWRSLAAAFPAGAVTARARRRRGEGFECWAAIGPRLWRTALRLREGALRPEAARRVTLPFAAADGGAVDLVLDLPGTDVAVVLPQMLAVRAEPGGAWVLRRPGLPGGGRIRRLSFALGRYWLATDRGLLEAPSLAGPWRRAAAPAGTAAVQDLAGDARRLVVATEAGVLAARAGPAPSADDRVPASAGSGDPRIEHVHRAAIGYLELGAGRLRALRKSVNRRAWLPVATLRAGYDDDRNRARDHDESFVSGEVRHLRDRDNDRSRDLELGVTLTWALGSLVYDPEQVDVSREVRALVELRDDVLDEITQLYYERRRVLAELERAAEPGARLRLRLRADELAAGIDAWTGGWFSRHTAPLAP
jgi:hypothetical protein